MMTFQIATFTLLQLIGHIEWLLFSRRMKQKSDVNEALNKQFSTPALYFLVEKDAIVCCCMLMLLFMCDLLCMSC